MGLDIGGAETHVIELARGLKAMGLRVAVASNGGAYESELAKAGVPHYKVPLHNKKLHNVIRAYFALKRIIKEHNIHLVHAHARIPAFLCSVLQKRLNFRFVTTAHFNFVNIFPYNLLTNWGERTLAVSLDLSEYLQKNYKTPKERINITVNGIDTERFKPRGEDADEAGAGADFLREFNIPPAVLKILCVTRLDKEPGKIAFILCEAAVLLNNPDVCFIIIGGGAHENAVRLAAANANKTLGKEVVIVTGGRTDIPDILPIADIFVGISRAALEAMACGLPVILSGGYGSIGVFAEKVLPKSLDTNFTCRGCPPATAKTLAKDLKTLINASAKKRGEIAAYGREIVKKHYSVQKMCEDAAAVYTRVLQTPPAQPRFFDCLLFGYYGSGNNGDDALLKAILDELRKKRPQAAIAVLSRRPKETARLHGLTAVYLFNIPRIIRTLKRTRLLISGGGTLLQDVTSTRSLLYYLFIIRYAKSAGARVMLYANGLGPVVREANKKRIKDTLEVVDCVTLRDEASLDFLAALRLSPPPPAYLTADVAFSLALPQNHTAALKKYRLSGKRFFTVALRRWRDTAADFVCTAAAFCDNMYEKYGLTAVFVPMQPQEDAPISRRVIRAMKTPAVLVDAPITTDEILSLTARAAFVFSMRLHTIIYAAKSATPALALVYDPKVRSMMEILRQNTYTAANEARLDELLEFAEYIMQNTEEISLVITECVKKQAALSQISINQAARLL